MEKYEYRDVNLNSSIPEKINKSIPLPDDYWKVHEQDVKIWKIGCNSPNRPVSLRDLPKDSSDWEFNVQKYENLSGDRRANRIQYYTGAADTNHTRKHSLDTPERKEIKFPGLKAFKSASMRLPGQKSSLQEVHQMLRNKFNRLNVGLRKKRTLSVQEVFQQSPSSQQSSARNTPTQFYVPSPVASNKMYSDDNTSNRSSTSNEPTSLPQNVNNTKLNTMNNNNNNNQINTANGIRCVSPIKSTSPVKNGDLNKQITRTQSYRTKIIIPAANDSNAKNITATTTESDQNKSNAKSPQFIVGGRVSLRDKCSNKTSTASKISNAVRERIRRRPRSHSPAKPKELVSNGQNRKKNRDSIGFFDRINRIMSVNHLPPPHNSNNNNNNTNNNLNRSKTNGNSIGSHESNATSSSSTDVAATKKIQNDDTTKTSNDDPVNNNNNHHNNNNISNNGDFRQSKPETIFIRDRKITTKQVTIKS